MPASVYSTAHLFGGGGGGGGGGLFYLVMQALKRSYFEFDSKIGSCDESSKHF